jgi:predicted nucleotidyltransferase component of viral defense system
MGKPEPRDLAASVHGRLLRLARERGESLEYLLMRFATERFLYRLSRSAVRDRFVLKGATLFAAWEGDVHRATRDVDLLKFGENAPDAVVEAVRAMATTGVEPDGLAFDPATVRAEPIREGQEYGGVRVTLLAHLGRARVRVQVDVGFGDAVTPGVEEVELPPLLDFPAPRLMGYPRETVVAEKLQAMVALGMANSRMKDFYDLWHLARTFPFDGPTLTAAVAATFERRGTPVPAGPPLALTVAFAADAAKRAQWAAFVRRSGLEAPMLEAVVEELGRFLLPVLEAARGGAPVEGKWSPGGPGWERGV